MKDGAGFLHFLYDTAPGRVLLKLLTMPWISRMVGRFMDSDLSTFLIRDFAKKNQISLKGIQIPEGGFLSFNEFFCREKEVVVFDQTPGRICSPCDGELSVYAIDDASRFHIKNSTYSLEELLRDGELAGEFQGGMALIFRLEPRHYHRYHFIDNGKILSEKIIPGVLHCVRPIATEQYPVYVQNCREYAVLETESFGKMIQMEIGALLVGKILNHQGITEFQKGDEKGYFAYGGSSIVLLFRKGVLGYNPKAQTQIAEAEIPVEVGKQITVSAKK